MFGTAGLRIFCVEEEHEDKTVVEVLKEENNDVQLLEEFEGALIGIQRIHDQPPVAAYDYYECIRILEDDGLEYWQALECFQGIISNISGDHRPVFIELQEVG